MITEEERAFLAYIKAHRGMGYGRMMQIISNCWYRQVEREYPGIEDGAFVGVPLAFQNDETKRAFFAVLAQEEQAGMVY